MVNKYEHRLEQQRRSSMRSSMSIGTAAVALLVVVLLIYGLSNSAPSAFFSRTAIGAAIVLLILRQVARRTKGRGGPKAAEPDPESRLKLD